MLEEIKNSGRLPLIVAVILPEIMSFKITLLRILSIMVLKRHVCWLDWIIYGKYDLVASEFQNSFVRLSSLSCSKVLLKSLKKTMVFVLDQNIL